MEMYKQASKLKLRFNTPRGPLGMEQLWDLTQTDLAASIKAVKKTLKDSNDDELSFLEENKSVDVEAQLRYDILKDVFLTKKKENEDARNAADDKAKKQRIMELISEKKDESLKGKSIEELEALLK